MILCWSISEYVVTRSKNPFVRAKKQFLELFVLGSVASVVVCVWMAFEWFFQGEVEW